MINKTDIFQLLKVGVLNAISLIAINAANLELFAKLSVAFVSVVYTSMKIFELYWSTRERCAKYKQVLKWYKGRNESTKEDENTD